MSALSDLIASADANTDGAIKRLSDSRRDYLASPNFSTAATYRRAIVAVLAAFDAEKRAFYTAMALIDRTVESDRERVKALNTSAELRPGTRVVVRLDDIPRVPHAALAARYGHTEEVATVQRLDPMNAGVFLGNLESGGGVIVIPKAAIIRKL